jgi:cation transport ATPase
MYNISDEQIDYILSDISARGVKVKDLQQNILDHVCCIIEQNLEVTGDFKNFYLRTIETFYKKELSEIEEETNLLLTFKNYYTMKKAMITSGAFSAIQLLLGCLFKFMHWPGAAMMIFVGVLLLSFLFLPLLFILKMKEATATRDKVILTLGVLIGILYFIAPLFKVMHWPGANVLLFTTIALVIFLFIPIYFFTGIRKPETRINTIVSTILIVGVVSMQFTLMSLRKPSATAEINNPKTVEMVKK